jgi:phospholipid-transporting ATPase
MELSQCSIDGQIFSNDFLDAFKNREKTLRKLIAAVFFKHSGDSFGVDKEIAREFFLNILLDNALVPKLRGAGEDSQKDLGIVDPLSITWIGESPDEIALVDALRSNGLVFSHKNGNEMSIQIQDPYGTQQITFTLLAILKFTSNRRRLSVVIRDEKGTVKLYTKGADTSVLPFVSDKKSADEARRAATIENLKYFAETFASRTLVMAVRTLRDSEFMAWKSIYDSAATSLEARERRIEQAFGLIEKDMTLLGCTAVEDQLQSGVPETIEDLRKAGIVIMVLTGDKLETALSIGKSSKIVFPDSQLLFMSEDSLRDIETVLDDIIRDLKIEKPGFDSKVTRALVIDGFTLELAVKSVMEKFMRVFLICNTIVCYRATPSQKALIVSTVKENLKKMCLAIGDGANDVSMIQTAQVGVGIQGKEGAQAALTADFVLLQFRHLLNLLFVHGRYSYIRTSKVVLFQFYKNAYFALPMFWFAFISGFSGQRLYESYIFSLFNVALTAFPPLSVGLLEKDLDEQTCLDNPRAFSSFRTFYKFGIYKYLSWMGLATYHSLRNQRACLEISPSLVSFFFAFGVFQNDVVTQDGRVSGIYSFGLLICFSAIVISNGVFLLFT